MIWQTAVAGGQNRRAIILRRWQRAGRNFNIIVNRHIIAAGGKVGRCIWGIGASIGHWWRRGKRRQDGKRGCIGPINAQIGQVGHRRIHRQYIVGIFNRRRSRCILRICWGGKAGQRGKTHTKGQACPYCAPLHSPPV